MLTLASCNASAADSKPLVPSRFWNATSAKSTIAFHWDRYKKPSKLASQILPSCAQTAIGRSTEQTRSCQLKTSACCVLGKRRDWLLSVGLGHRPEGLQPRVVYSRGVTEQQLRSRMISSRIWPKALAWTNCYRKCWPSRTKLSDRSRLISILEPTKPGGRSACLPCGLNGGRLCFVSPVLGCRVS